MKKKLAIFDLDGTLINSISSIAYHLNRTLKNNGLPEISLAQVQAFVGNSSRYLVEHAAEGADPERIERVLVEYNEAYRQSPLEGTEIYPGVLEGLEKLKEKYYLAVLSNKPDPIVMPIIESLFPGIFDFALGFREDIPRKPDPAGLYRICERFQAEPGETAYVGDSEVDWILGNRAGAKTLLVTYGFRTRESLEELGAKALFDDFGALVTFLLRG